MGGKSIYPYLKKPGDHQSYKRILDHPNPYQKCRVSMHAPNRLLNQFKGQIGVLSEIKKREELAKQGTMDPEIIALAARCSSGNALDEFGDYASPANRPVPKRKAKQASNRRRRAIPVKKRYSIELTVKDEATLKIIRPLHIMGSRPQVFNRNNKRPRVQLCIREFRRYNKLKKAQGEDPVKHKFLGDLEWEKKALEWSDTYQQYLRKLAKKAGVAEGGEESADDSGEQEYEESEELEEDY